MTIKLESNVAQGFKEYNSILNADKKFENSDTLNFKIFDVKDFDFVQSSSHLFNRLARAGLSQRIATSLSKLGYVRFRT